MLITKELLEQTIGYEIQDYKIENEIDDNNQLVKINVSIQPKRAVEFITVNLNIKNND